MRFSQHDLADLGITAVAELIGCKSFSCKSKLFLSSFFLYLGLRPEQPMLSFLHLGVSILSCFVDKLGRKFMLALPMALLGVFTLFLAAVASHR